MMGQPLCTYILRTVIIGVSTYMIRCVCLCVQMTYIHMVSSALVQKGHHLALALYIACVTKR